MGHMNTNLSQDGVDQLALRQGKIRIMIAGRMLLRSSVIQICVRVVMLVRMIRTGLPVTLHAKSCPKTHSSWPMASSSNLEAWLLLSLNSQCYPSSRTNGCPKNLLMASSSKGTHWPRTQERLYPTPSSVGHALA